MEQHIGRAVLTLTTMSVTRSPPPRRMALRPRTGGPPADEKLVDETAIIGKGGVRRSADEFELRMHMDKSPQSSGSNTSTAPQERETNVTFFISSASDMESSPKLTPVHPRDNRAVALRKQHAKQKEPQKTAPKAIRTAASGAREGTGVGKKKECEKEKENGEAKEEERAEETEKEQRLEKVEEEDNGKEVDEKVEIEEQKEEENVDEDWEVTYEREKRTKYKDNKSHAQAVLQKGIIHLRNSGNISKVCRKGIYGTLRTLMRLVTDTETGRERETRVAKKKDREIYTIDGETKGNHQDGDEKKVGNSDEKDKDRNTDADSDGKIVEMIKEHTKLLQENKKEMAKLTALLEGEREREKGNEEERRKENEKCMDLLKGNGLEIVKLKDEVGRLHEERRTYASVAAEPPSMRPVGAATIHSVIVTSQEETDTGEEVMERIRTAVNAREEGTKIECIRKAKDRKVIIGFGTREEMGKVKERLEKSGKKLNVAEIPNKDPLVVLKDVAKSNKDEDIIRGLRNQNKHLLKSLSKDDDRMEVRFRRRARNSLMDHVVLKVSPMIWGRLIKAGAVHIDVQKVRVLDQSPLVQCSRCLGYGHSRRFCRDTADLCCYCGGTHMSIDCRERREGCPPKCINCTRAKFGPVNHSAFSEECPVRRRWDDLARGAVQYC